MNHRDSDVLAPRVPDPLWLRSAPRPKLSVAFAWEVQG